MAEGGRSLARTFAKTQWIVNQPFNSKQLKDCLFRACSYSPEVFSFDLKNQAIRMNDPPLPFPEDLVAIPPLVAPRASAQQYIPRPSQYVFGPSVEIPTRLQPPQL
jgi:hypothetical protein